MGSLMAYGLSLAYEGLCVIMAQGVLGFTALWVQWGV